MCFLRVLHIGLNRHLRDSCLKKCLATELYVLCAYLLAHILQGSHISIQLIMTAHCCTRATFGRPPRPGEADTRMDNTTASSSILTTSAVAAMDTNTTGARRRQSRMFAHGTYCSRARACTHKWPHGLYGEKQFRMVQVAVAARPHAAPRLCRRRRAVERHRLRESSELTLGTITRIHTNCVG